MIKLFLLSLFAQPPSVVSWVTVCNLKVNQFASSWIKWPNQQSPKQQKPTEVSLKITKILETWGSWLNIYGSGDQWVREWSGHLIPWLLPSSLPILSTLIFPELFFSQKISICKSVWIWNLVRNVYMFLSACWLFAYVMLESISTSVSDACNGKATVNHCSFGLEFSHVLWLFLCICVSKNWNFWPLEINDKAILEIPEFVLPMPHAKLSLTNSKDKRFKEALTFEAAVIRS